MADSRLGVETLSELQIWIDGKFELVSQTQGTTAEDVRQVRSRVHDLAQDVTKLLALDIAGKLKKLEEADTTHEANIAKFITDAAERKGALATLKALYTVIGALAGGAIVTLLRLYEALKL